MSENNVEKKSLRDALIEALRTVDTDDWNSYDGSTQRSIGAVLQDIASRLEAVTEEER